ncbi:MAG: cation transporter [candidate division Zixibacteria bacterium]|nr:cation transporter [candidate division Zixibacteria bacterium]MCI0596003.1 cation transporter [candidate division Zixibacteria bacterium]
MSFKMAVGAGLALALFSAVVLFGEEAKTEKVTLDVKGMTCSGCASFLQSKLSKTEGIKSVKVDLASDQAFVEYDPAVITVEKVATAVDEKTAFTATVAQATGVETQSKPDVKEAEKSPTATKKSVSKTTARKAKTDAKPEAAVLQTKYRCEHCKRVQDKAGKCSACGAELTAVDVSYECAACGVHSATSGFCTKCGKALQETLHQHIEKPESKKAPSTN